MSDERDNRSDRECAVCYAVHDEEIHEATLSIHRWFHNQVTHDFEDNSLYMHELDPRLAAV